MKKSILAVKQKYELGWMSLDGVEGVGITDEGEEEVIVVYISKKNKELEKKIPTKVGGYKIKLQSTGKFQAF